MKISKFTVILFLLSHLNNLFAQNIREIIKIKDFKCNDSLIEFSLFFPKASFNQDIKFDELKILEDNQLALSQCQPITFNSTYLIDSTLGYIYPVKYISPDKAFDGSKRVIRIIYNSVPNDTIVYRLGSPMYNNKSFKSIDIIKGLSLLLILLLLIAVFLPIIQYSYFCLKYVRPYWYYKKIRPHVKIENQHTDIQIGDLKAEYCPFDSEEFKKNEIIVNKCNHILHYRCWKENKFKCPEFPHRCKNGYYEFYTIKNFFSQRSNAAKYSWMLFGALAGLLSWWLFMSTKDNSHFYKSILFNLFSINKDNLNIYLYNTLAGSSLGVIIFIIFTFLEELRIGLTNESIKKNISKGNYRLCDWFCYLFHRFVFIYFIR